MADYTFFSAVEPLKNNNTIQVIFDIDALAAPAKSALSAYVNSLGLPGSQTEHLLWQNVGVAVVIESLSINYYLPSLGSQTPALNLKRNSSMRDKVIEMQSLSSRFPKCQLLIFARNSSSATWVWINTEVIQNSGNVVNTLKLLPYINQSDIFIPGRGTQIGIQFIADQVTNTTLPQAQDRITVQGSVRLDVNPIDSLSSKKNDGLEELTGRIAALENLLGLFGAATATASGTNGLVKGAEVGQAEYLLRGDRTWQNPDNLVQTSKNQIVAGVKTFIDLLTGNQAVRSIGAGSLSSLYTQSQAVLFGSGGGGYLSLISHAAPANSRIVDFELNPSGSFSVRRINDAYTSIVSVLMQFDTSHNLKLFNFTNFGGNISIKILYVTGVTPASQGGILNLPLGIDSSKVVAFFPFIHFDANGRMPPGFTQVAGHEYDSYIDENLVVFRLSAANSANAVNKTCSCLVIYTN